MELWPDSDADEQGDVAASPEAEEEQGGLDDEFIVREFRPNPKDGGRTAQYNVSLHADDEPEWRLAKALQGEAWDRALRKFWKANNETAYAREIMLNPNAEAEELIEDLQGCDWSPYRKYIKYLLFEEDRNFVFEVRGRDISMPLMHDDEDRHCAEDLGPEWNYAIHEYWMSVASCMGRVRRRQEYTLMEREKEKLFRPRPLPQIHPLIERIYGLDPRILKE
ncbi:hypothetical protein AC578_7793 [Pseudocercospora eumusae]|uniref:Uncharacterized protein n=1 Tax=Pseudocercospora eumusae TaxID=321146 RepID=A0A139GW52_9PEZI|nr:hypothetical protein AC578_7793 [Pseudocercospora eumusae]